MEKKEPSPLPRNDVHSSKRTHSEHSDTSVSRVKIQIVPDECIFEKDVMCMGKAWFVGDANGHHQINTNSFKHGAWNRESCDIESNRSIDTGGVISHATLSQHRERYSDSVECRLARRVNDGWNRLCGYSRLQTLPIVPFIFGVIISIRWEEEVP